MAIASTITCDVCGRVMDSSDWHFRLIEHEPPFMWSRTFRTHVDKEKEIYLCLQCKSNLDKVIKHGLVTILQQMADYDATKSKYTKCKDALSKIIKVIATEND